MRIYSDTIKRVKTATLVAAVSSPDYVILDGDIYDECHILASTGDVYGCKSWGGYSTIWAISRLDKDVRRQVRIKNKVLRIDHLVAKHFLPPKPQTEDKWELYHINGHVGDDRSENLAWRRVKDRYTTTPLQKVQERLSALAQMTDDDDDIIFS